MSCPYANILGEVGKGVHSFRLFDFSIIDILLTVLGAYLISKSFKVKFWKAFLGLFILGEILHYIFGVKSKFLRVIGMTPNCN